MRGYQDASEEKPWNKPVPTVNFMSTHCFVYANHAGYTETRRSQTVIFLFCNKTSIILVQQKAELSRSIYIEVSVRCNEECSLDHIVPSLRSVYVTGPN